VAERTIAQVRSDIERERSLLVEELAALREEAHAILPFAMATVIALGLARNRRMTMRLLRLLARLR
jgi:hypothetical protein